MNIIIDKPCVKCNIGYMELWTDKFIDSQKLLVVQFSWFECNNCHIRDYIFSNDPLESQEMIGGEEQ